MKLYEIATLDYDGHSNTQYMVDSDPESVKERFKEQYYEDDYLQIIVNEVEIPGFKINISIDPEGVKEIETDGWLVKVGQVYSSPYQPAHFRIDKVVMTDDDTHPESAMLHGTWVNPNNYEEETYNDESQNYKDSFRAWHLNEQYSLEEGVNN
ncbi:hypothetical protein [Sporosarcina sp. FSL W7-1283]|uniref:hypothetical protein n=1 Tax=Sporosarcina sp. FSL W7-1283 TaxID=2921560 RepID=UPI0030FB017A